MFLDMPGVIFWIAVEVTTRRKKSPTWLLKRFVFEPLVADLSRVGVR
jgi:hypothetical protein